MCGGGQLKSLQSLFDVGHLFITLKCQTNVSFFWYFLTFVNFSKDDFFQRRLRQAVGIDKMQIGFRSSTGTTDAIFIARQLQDSCKTVTREI